MNPHVVPRPCVGHRARVVEQVVRLTLRPTVDRVRLTPRLLRYVHLADLAGFPLPAPRGTTVEPVRSGFRADLIRGPGGDSTARAVLYLHGGVFITCDRRVHRRLAARISSAAEAPVLQVAYRQLPDATLADSIEDCLAGYRWLLDRGYPPTGVVFAGDSAGGFLAFATALRVRAEGLPMPAGILGLSPFLDLHRPAHADNPHAEDDPVFGPRFARHLVAVLPALLAGGGEPVSSPLDADLSGLPPVQMHVGAGEWLRCDAELMVQRLASAGVPVRLDVWDRQVHVFPILADFVSEGRVAINDAGAFIRRVTTASHADVA